MTEDDISSGGITRMASVDYSRSSMQLILLKPVCFI